MATKQRAVSYLRVSGLGQVDGDGFTRQAESVARYAKRAGVEIIAEFRDSGVSGTNELADRPGLSELVDSLTATGVTMVLVENATRLARDLLISEVILSRFRAAGVQVLDCDSGTDLTVADGNATAKLVRQVLSAISEFDRTVTVQKLAGARRRIRERVGRCEGRKPYGDRPGEAEIVALIKKLRRKPRGGDQLSFAAIAAELDRRKIPTRSGGPWRASVVGQILSR